MAEELHKVVAARQSEFSMPGRDRHDAKTRGAGKALGVDCLGETWRVKFCAHAGIRTGSDSMPRTKLE